MSGTAAQDRAVRMAAGALIGLVMTAISWFFLIEPQLSSASELRAQTQDVISQNQITALRNANLARQSRQLPHLQEQLRAALGALPSDSGLPAFTRELNDLAAASHIDLAGIDVGSLSPVSASGVATNTTGTGQFAIPVTVTAQGAFADLSSLLNRIETGPRGVVVTSTQITQAETARVASVDSGATMTVQLTVFSSPLSKAEAAQIDALLHASN